MQRINSCIEYTLTQRLQGVDAFFPETLRKRLNFEFHHLWAKRGKKAIFKIFRYGF